MKNIRIFCLKFSFFFFFVKFSVHLNRHVFVTVNGYQSIITLYFLFSFLGIIESILVAWKIKFRLIRCWSGVGCGRQS